MPDEGTTLIEVRDMRIEQGGFTLDGISFTVPEGGYGVLMGRSGCGKSTILEAICGLRPLAGGEIRLAHRSPTASNP